VHGSDRANIQLLRDPHHPQVCNKRHSHIGRTA
jgi:hypothetical protein